MAALKKHAPALKEYGDPAKFVKRVGDGNNAHPLVYAMVLNNICKRGPVIFGEMAPGEAIKRYLDLSEELAHR